MAQTEMITKRCSKTRKKIDNKMNEKNSTMQTVLSVERWRGLITMNCVYPALSGLEAKRMQITLIYRVSFVDTQCGSIALLDAMIYSFDAIAMTLFIPFFVVVELILF